MNVYVPRACPISATPAALPIESSDPPTPAVSVTSNHCPLSIGGCIDNTANITGILSMSADKTPMATFALVAPKPPYATCDSASR